MTYSDDRSMFKYVLKEQIDELLSFKYDTHKIKQAISLVVVQWLKYLYFELIA